MDKKVKILWLFNDILDLYGDFGNITAITYQLEQLGVPYEITHAGLDDEINPQQFDLVYAGPGKDKNVIMATEYLMKYRDAVQQAIEGGVLFLITGNAQMMFGNEIEEQDGTKHQALGFFSYSAQITGDVFISDMVMTPNFSNASASYGFINRTSYLVGKMAEYPLFKINYSEKDIGTTEGILYKNFMGTWALGPVLAKNPHILKEVLCRMLGVSSLDIDDGMQNIALQRTLSEFDEVLKQTR